jgi:hypothetical protein
VAVPEKNPKNIRNLTVDNSRTACGISYAYTHRMGTEHVGSSGYTTAFKIPSDPN